MPMKYATPEDEVAAMEARSDRRTTTHEGCTMVWRRWGPPRTGAARPLVLLHGGSGTWRHWIRNIDAFAVDREVWVPDMPGFGESDPPPAPINFAAVAKVVGAGIDELLVEGSRFDLCGFSFGSHTSQYIADRFGERVGTTVFATAHILGPLLALPNQMLERWRDITDRAERDRILKRNLGALMLAHESSMDPLALHIYAGDVVRARIRPATFINDRDYKMVERLACRVAGIAGGLDPLGVPSPAAQGEALMKARPDARFQLIENAGHWICYEAPVEFNATLRRFLDT